MSSERETNMMHLSCGICGMTATVVATPSADLAWADHMSNHGDPSNFRAWTWTVVPLTPL